MAAFESQNTHSDQQIKILVTRLTLLTDELLLQPPIYQLQSILLLLITTTAAVSVVILFFNRGSTSSNLVSLGGIRGGSRFLTRHLPTSTSLPRWKRFFRISGAFFPRLLLSREITPNTIETGALPPGHALFVMADCMCEILALHYKVNIAGVVITGWVLSRRFCFLFLVVVLMASGPLLLL